MLPKLLAWATLVEPEACEQLMEIVPGDVSVWAPDIAIGMTVLAATVRLCTASLASPQTTPVDVLPPPTRLTRPLTTYEPAVSVGVVANAVMEVVSATRGDPFLVPR